MEAPSGDPLRAEKLKLLRDHGIATDPFCDGTESGGAWFGLRSELFTIASNHTFIFSLALATP